MKAWLLLSRFEGGGLERVQVALAPMFIENGIDTTIVAGKFNNTHKATIPKTINTIEIAPSKKLQFIPNLIREIKRHKPDVILTTSNDIACITIILRLLYFPATKIICTQHQSLIAPAKYSGNIFRSAKHLAIVFFMRLLFPKADSLIAVSNAVADEMATILNLKTKINVIHNPVITIDFDKLTQAKHPSELFSSTAPNIIYVGRLSKEKRVDILINAFEIVIRKTPSRLLILGDGPEEKSLINLVEKKSLSQHCYMVGFQSNPLPWINAADLLVLTSDYEGFGISLVEAMACGTQVISTNCPSGPSEILENGHYGQLIPPNNHIELAKAIYRSLTKDFYVPPSALKSRANAYSQQSSSLEYIAVITKTLGDSKTCASH